MDRSMISMIYFVALLALFLIMIIATIAVIASRSRRRDEDDDEFEDGTEYEDTEQPDEGQTVFDDADAMLSDDFYVDNLDMPGRILRLHQKTPVMMMNTRMNMQRTAIMMTSIQRMQMIPMKSMRM